MARRTDIMFPLGGLDRRWSFQQQPPYTTPDCLNVRPDGRLERRERGGSRPGLGKAFYEQLGSGNPVRMLAQVELPVGSLFEHRETKFEGTALSDNFSALTNVTSTVPTIYAMQFAAAEAGVTNAALHESLTNFDSSSDYAFRIFIVPNDGEHHGTYYLYLRMTSGLDPTVEGVVVSLTMTGSAGAYSWSVTEYVASTPTVIGSGSGTDSYPAAGWLEARINPMAHPDEDTIQVLWNGTELLAASDLASPETASAFRFGYGMSCSTTGRTLIDRFVSRHFQTVIQPASKSLLVGSSNGVMFRERDEGYLQNLTTLSPSNLKTAGDRLIQAAAWGGKLYVADYETFFKGTDGIIDAGGTGGALDELTATGVSDWTIGNILGNAAYSVIEISDGASGVTDGQYQFSGSTPVSTSRLLASTDMATGTGPFSCSYRVERAAKIYNPIGPTFNLWFSSVTAGSLPVGADKICAWRDRIVLARDNVWYMSRQGDPLDWDFAADADDPQRAVAGTVAIAGRTGQNITALIPHSRDYLILGTTTEIWVIRGDPAQGGTLDNVSRNIGIIGKASWCHGPDGEIIALTHDGLYAVSAGGAQSLSREKLPRELLNTDRTQFTPLLAYDVSDRGVHIYLTGRNPAHRYHWWFDWETKTYWPLVLQDDHEPTAILEYNTPHGTGDNGVILGCRDGYLRRFRTVFETDDGSEIESHVLIGPFRLGGDDLHEGTWNELVAALATECGPATWEIFVGATHEEAVTNAMTGTAIFTGSWSAGLNQSDHPRARGVSAVLKVSNSSSIRCWSVERITGIFETAGRMKVV